ncbi:NADP-dependent oxidoreductase [Sinomonas sp. JGH33]|uniref:NADP-dependent oxidoreductase n=1 Tax=Sinomonas terricola TaxID=3110330 RepID=A0ABU5T230_9MICC|nr:NADP-dependent oxidoreductase [Sinomonas sp. JGH33]MEA5453723.1 NADP-dependent oxidoreductase [Sinomonas sp. JGH33]
MQVAGINEIGGPVEILDVQDPRPLAADEVLIAVKAAGIGNWDEIVRTGGWDVGASVPMALGVEAAGVVTEVGENVDGFHPGDEVLCHPLQLRHQGAWAPLLIAPASLLARKPASVAWETAAAFPVPALTAEQVLTEALALKAGETLLVHGAGGVTGGLLVQLAVLRGANVLATSGPASMARVRQYGALEVFDYNDPSWPALARRVAAAAGITAVVNAARDGAATAMSTLVDGGRLATITSDPPAEERGISVSNVYVRPDGAQLERLAELLGNDQLTFAVASSNRLAGAGAALAAVVAGGVSGAAVVIP